MLKVTNIIRIRDDYDIMIQPAANQKTERHAYYNISTNVKIGVSGKQVQNLNYNSTILSLLMEARHNNNVREFCDRMISLPTYDFDTKNQICRQAFQDFGTIKCATIILENWREFLEYAKNLNHLTFPEYIREKKTQEALSYIKDKQVQQTIIKYLIGSELSSFIKYSKKYKQFRKDVLNAIKRTQKIIENREYLFSLINIKTDDENYQIQLKQKYGLQIIDPYASFPWFLSNLCDLYNKLDKLLNNLHIKDYNFTDVRIAIRDLQSLYDTQASALFAEQQNKGNLLYENDNFKIFVPTTRKELAYYGELFSNCLNGYEWDNYLSIGSRYAVIVLDKTKNNKPIVCIDINCDKRDIKQYLGKANSTIYNEELQIFRQEYQTYLTSSVANI